MQLMPATAARFGLTAAERFDAAKNIRAGIRYLKVLSRLFGGDLDLILAGYNAGEGAVLKYGRRIPPYRETQTYVRRVRGYYARYRQRARHRQTRTLMAQANERRQRLRARADEVLRDREPSRERSPVGAGNKCKPRNGPRPPTWRLTGTTFGIVAMAVSLCVQAEPPPLLYRQVAARYGLSAEALYAQAIRYAGRQSRFASAPTPWPWTVRLCQHERCETVFADDRATLAAILKTASRAGWILYVGPLGLPWSPQSALPLDAITSPRVSVNAAVRRWVRAQGARTVIDPDSPTRVTAGRFARSARARRWFGLIDRVAARKGSILRWFAPWSRSSRPMTPPPFRPGRRRVDAADARHGGTVRPVSPSADRAGTESAGRRPLPALAARLFRPGSPVGAGRLQRRRRRRLEIRPPNPLPGNPGLRPARSRVSFALGDTP